MKNSTKTLLCAVGFAALTAGSAYAQSAPDWALSGTIDGQSDYRFRGISQNAKKIAPQGSLNLTGPDGWYIGSWASQIDWNPSTTASDPEVEWDIFAGKHFALDEATDLNVEAYYYAYPSAPYTGTTASYFEGIFQLSHTFFGVALTGTWAISPQFSFKTGLGNYLEGTASFPLTDWLSVSANVGHQWVDKLPDYTHADAGLTATWKGFSLDGRYVTTDLGAVNCGAYMTTRNACSGGFVATLSYTIPLLP